MGEAAMMSESINRSFESPKYIKIGRFGGEGHGGGGQRGLAVESHASQNGAGEEVGDGFQEEFVPQQCSCRDRACPKQSRKTPSPGSVERSLIILIAEFHSVAQPSGHRAPNLKPG